MVHYGSTAVGGLVVGAPSRCTVSIFLKVSIILIGKRHGVGLLEILLHGLHDLGVDGGLGGSQGGGGDKLQRGVSGELSSQPQEGLLKVVVGLGGNVVVLEVLLSVEGDGLGLDLSLLDVDLVSAQDDGDVLAHSNEISVPVGHVLVCDSGGDVEHDDSALAVDVVAVSETSELLLSSGIPHVESDVSAVGGEVEGVHLHSEGGVVSVHELTGLVSLNEGGLC